MSNYNIEHAWRYQKAVYWAASGIDNYGVETVDAPVEVDVRWQYVNEESIDANGGVVAIDAIVVVNVEVPNGSVFWKGTLEAYTALATKSGYYRATVYNDTPDIKNQYVRQTVKLMRYSDTLPELTA